MNEDFFIELVAMWCDAESKELYARAKMIRRRYAKSAFPELAFEFSEMLERHARGFHEKREQLLKRSRETTR